MIKTPQDSEEGFSIRIILVFFHKLNYSISNCVRGLYPFSTGISSMAQETLFRRILLISSRFNQSYSSGHYEIQSNISGKRTREEVIEARDFREASELVKRRFADQRDYSIEQV